MLKAQKGFLTFDGVIGLVVLFGFAYIVVVKMVWEPMQHKNEYHWRAFSEAKSVQVLVKMYHTDEELQQLDQPVKGGGHLIGKLNSFVEESGESIETGYHPLSRGHALALSNRVLTGDSSPVLVDLSGRRKELERKEKELARGW